MGRKKQTYQPHQRRPNSSVAFVQVFHDMLDSPAFHDLTAKQVQLFLYCLRETHGRATADDPQHDTARFYFNRHLQTVVHELYAPSDYRGFERDMQSLIEHGFCDMVSSGYATKEKNVYRLSSRWHHWGSKAFSMPESCMSTHQKIARRKCDG